MRAAIMTLAIAMSACTFAERRPDDRSVEIPASTEDINEQDGLEQLAEGDTSDRFCNALAKIIAQEANGFAGLRGKNSGEASWSGKIQPLVDMRCEVEGSEFPSAAYLCREPALLNDEGSILDGRFGQLSDQLDDCFSRPVWYPRNWQRGRLFQFAGGERQLMWRDTARLPKPAVTLAIEESIDIRAYQIRLSVITLR